MPRPVDPDRRPAARPATALGLLGGLTLACAAAVAGTALSTRVPGADEAVSPASFAAGSATGTPAERRIAEARASIDLHPKRVSAWNDLAMALARRARETADTAFYREAWAATERSLALEPRNLEARKTQAWILLGQHEFPRAVEVAEAVNTEVPDDVLTYGLLVDGYTELGRYDRAETAAQWMLDLRPGNVPALTRAAHLRELFGDHEGAVELMDVAYRRIADAEVEDRAWILTQIGHLSLLTCRTEAAERLLTEALRLFPEYHYALAQMAIVRQQQGRLDEAVAYRERHVAAAPHPENLFELGAALHRAGRTAEAEARWATFERGARAEMNNWDSANVELIYYYADFVDRPDEALRIARREAARRQDVRTLEAYAWALHANGQSPAAWRELQRVLAVGVRQAATSYRAASVAAAIGLDDQARAHARTSVDMCATSEVAARARALMARPAG